jgi:spermidine/putrescine transport system permease protein
MSKIIVWHGEIISKKSLLKRGIAFIAPGILWLMLFLIIPSVLLALASFAGRGEYGELVWEFRFENYKRLAGFSLFGWTGDYLIILWRSLVAAFFTTLLSVILSYPLAFFIASKSPKKRYIWLTILIIPFWTNMVIRTYAWFIILAPDLPFAKLAAFFKLIPNGYPLYPGAFAVYLGMISIFLPFIALPLYSSVEKLNWELVEAARDLYASKTKVFMQAILPQTLPGLSVGIILTFVPAIGIFVTPDMLGGAKYMLVGNFIAQQFGTSRDWAFGAAISIGLSLLTLGSLYFYTVKAQKTSTAN